MLPIEPLAILPETTAAFPMSPLVTAPEAIWKLPTCPEAMLPETTALFPI